MLVEMVQAVLEVTADDAWLREARLSVHGFQSAISTSP